MNELEYKISKILQEQQPITESEAQDLAHFICELPEIKDKATNEIKVKVEFLFELANKQQWINRVPNILPDKTRAGETWIWVDKNGNVFESGADFRVAEENNTYPCKVYRTINVANAHV